MDVVNLQEQFGKRYRIAFDSAYDPKGRRTLDPWMMIIPCRYGEIWPYGGRMLAVEIESGRLLQRLLAAGCTLYRDGDDGATLLFNVDDFAAVAAIVRPKRRRQLTAEQRAKAGERLREFRFSTRTSERENAVRTGSGRPA